MTYVHDVEKGVVLPPHPERLFAIMRIKGTQFKVCKDDRVMVENLGEDFKPGHQLVFDDILMIGTPDYTSIG